MLTKKKYNFVISKDVAFVNEIHVYGPGPIITISYQFAKSPVGVDTVLVECTDQHIFYPNNS